MTGDARLRRIVVALDSSSASLEALADAAVIARRLGAELEGIFVEDANVLRAAGLPFASQLSLPSGTARPLDRRALEAELRALAAAAREALAEAAAAGGVGWSFRVARGQVSVELLHAAGRADLLVLGRTGRSLSPGPGGTARRAASSAERPVLLHGGGTSVDRPLLVAYDGSASAERALDAAARLAAAFDGLTLLVAAPTAADAERLASRARARTRAAALAARWVGGAGRSDLVHAVAAARGLLVLGAGSSLIGAGGPEGLLDEIASPLLIVR